MSMPRLQVRAGILAGVLLALASLGTQANPLYDQNCSVCHQAAGAGVPGSFPKLAGRAGKLAALPAGRKLLISAVLYGMSGKLQVEQQTIMGVMPPLSQLSDADIASILSYVSGLDHGSARAFTAAEVGTVRAQPPLTSAEVNALARDPELVKVAP
jgi:mono/diheme cytochrome c family protein